MVYQNGAWARTDHMTVTWGLAMLIWFVMVGVCTVGVMAKW